MKLYDYAASCNCYKVRLLLAHLGIDYERVPVDIFAGGTLTDEYGRINPMRTVPVLETEQGYLPESNAILTYLAEGTAYVPDDPWERARVVGWLIYEQTDVVFMVGGLRFRLMVGRWTPDHPEAVAPAGGRTRGAAVSRRPPGRRASSSSAGATRSPTSRSTAIPTAPKRRSSTSSRIPTCARGSSASSRSPGTWKTSSPTAPTPRRAPASPSTANRLRAARSPARRALIQDRPVPCRAGTADTRLASARRTPPRAPSICPCPGRS